MNVIIKFFQDGGFWMYPILVAGIVGGAFAVERFIKLKLLERANRKSWEELHPVLVSGDFERAREMVEGDDSAVAQLLSMGLEVQGTVRRRDDIEIAMEEAMMEITPQLQARTICNAFQLYCHGNEYHRVWVDGGYSSVDLLQHG